MIITIYYQYRSSYNRLLRATSLVQISVMGDFFLTGQILAKLFKEKTHRFLPLSTW